MILNNRLSTPGPRENEKGMGEWRRSWVCFSAMVREGRYHDRHDNRAVEE